MIENLTNTFVNKLKASEKPFEVRDANFKGLVLRVQPSGVMTYYLEYAYGKRVKIERADLISPAQARETAERIKAERCLTGKDPAMKKQDEKAEQAKRKQAEADAAKTAKANNYLSFLENYYEAHLRATLRKGVDNAENVKETMNNLRNRFPDFHNLALAEITPLLIDRWIHRRTDEGRKPTSIRRQLNDLRACLNYAAKRGALTESPFEKMDAYKAQEEERVRYLSPEEEERLRKALDDRDSAMKAARKRANAWREERGYGTYTELDECAFADHLKPAVLLTLNTGLRQGELLKLKWRSVDFERGMLTVEASTAKSAKLRHIKLNAEATEILRAWKEQPGVKSQYVFCDRAGKPFGNMRTSWESLVKKAELEDFRWHDLRHTFASKLVINGVDLYRVKTLLGHSDFKMTQRYAHLEPHHMQDAVDTLCAQSARAL